MPSPQVAEILAGLEDEVAHVVTVIVTEAIANLQEATPVKTGWARANWIPSVGEPSTVPDGAPCKPGEKTEAGEAAKDGLARIQRYELADGSAFIANNAPYIQRLNDGSSTQAQGDFVDRAVDYAVQDVGAQVLARSVTL